MEILSWLWIAFFSHLGDRIAARRLKHARCLSTLIAALADDRQQNLGEHDNMAAFLAQRQRNLDQDLRTETWKLSGHVQQDPVSIMHGGKGPMTTNGSDPDQVVVFSPQASNQSPIAGASHQFAALMHSADVGAQ